MIKQLLLGCDSSPAYLRDTVEFAARVEIDAAMFECLQDALASLLLLDEPHVEIVAQIAPAITKFVDAKADLPDVPISLPAATVCSFVVKVGDAAAALIDYASACARANSRFAVELEMELARMRPQGNKKGIWAVMSARISIARKISEDQRALAFQRIVEKLREQNASSDCWDVFVEGVCEVTQRIEAKWVERVWKMMLMSVPDHALQGHRSRVAFEVMFRVLDCWMEPSAKRQFVQTIVKMPDVADKRRIEFLSCAWPWSRTE
jgi:hypothetical protein